MSAANEDLIPKKGTFSKKKKKKSSLQKVTFKKAQYFRKYAQRILFPPKVETISMFHHLTTPVWYIPGDVVTQK